MSFSLKLIMSYPFVVVGVLTFVIVHTYFHELGHIIKCRKFSNSKLGMVLNRFIIRKRSVGIINKNNLLKRKIGYEIYNDKYAAGISKEYGRTYTEYDFKEFNPEQLKEIAKFGIILQTIFGLTWSIFLSIVCGVLFKSLIIMLFVFVFNVLIVIWAYIGTVTKKIKTDTNNWHDRRIWKDPQGFYNYIRSESSANDRKFSDYFKQ